MAKKNPLSTEEKREYQEEPGGQFREGNPGRPKGSKNKFSVARLEEAIEAEEKIAKEAGSVGIFQQFIRLAYTEPSVMIALMKKFLPDMVRSDVKVTSIYEEYEKMSDEELIENVNTIIKRSRTFKSDKDSN